MARSRTLTRLTVTALMMSLSLGAQAEREEPDESSSRSTVGRVRPISARDQIRNACDANAVSVRLRDQGVAREDTDHAPRPAPRREDEAQRAVNHLGVGVASETDGSGQTLSWKRSGTRSQCRAKLRRIRRDFAGRATFEPTTEERVAEVRRRHDELVPQTLRQNASDETAAKGLFDGGGFFSWLFGSGRATPARTAPPAPIVNNVRDTALAPRRQLPMQYRGVLTQPPPAPVSNEPVTFAQSVSNAYDASTAYVSQSIDDASQWVTGVARSVRNRFYSGIEMIQGYGYKFIHAARHTNWGTRPLVDGLRKISAYMRSGGRAETDLAVGDISSANGGQLGRHASHKTGRDVDIGYYMTDMAGTPVDAPGFVRFNSGRDGLTGYIGKKAVRFDAQRNWYLVQAVLANNDPGFEPTHIFIATHLEAAILAAAGDSPEKARAAALMRYWKGHDNHLHLRVQ